jgi:hypothetical protein
VLVKHRRVDRFDENAAILPAARCRHVAKARATSGDSSMDVRTSP